MKSWFQNCAFQIQPAPLQRGVPGVRVAVVAGGRRRGVVRGRARSPAQRCNVRRRETARAVRVFPRRLLLGLAAAVRRVRQHSHQVQDVSTTGSRETRDEKGKINESKGSVASGRDGKDYDVQEK